MCSINRIVFSMLKINGSIYVCLSTTTVQFQYDTGPVINTDSGLFFLTAIIYDSMFSGHIISGHNEACIVVVSLSIGKAVLCLMLGAQIVFTPLFLARYFATCFCTFKKDTFKYMQCGYTQWCILPEFLGANLIIIISGKDFWAQILHTSIRIVAVATIEMSQLVFYFCKSCSSALFSVVFQFAYRMLKNQDVQFYRVFYCLHWICKSIQDRDRVA